MRANRLIVWMGLAMILFVTACGQAPQSADHTNKKAGAPSQTAGGFPITLQDKSGTDVKIEKKPTRIVSIIPSTTEIAFAVGAGNEIVGVSNYDNYPAEAAKKEKVGDLKVNKEKVVALNPDLVLADSSSGDAVTALRKSGLTVLVTEAKNIDEVYKSIGLIGEATGHTGEADKLVQNMQADVRAVQEKVKAIPDEKKPKVWVEVDPSLFTAGKGTFIDDMVTLAGGKNIAADVEGWKKLSEEKVLERNPDVILNTYGYYDKEATAKILKRPTWQQVKAVQTKRVQALDSDVVTRPGPRITQGLQEVARALHPDLFK
ncbi:iron complex transport system substrate-binding protein [Aneurinibacillus soli]|uniref:Vitamin B12-binding protein n=1 Tax=Aneurinibacillus soli TaxID=1500254 RepID=A0A0U5B0F4_9BACL|nr:ABC transporter substrate-binding protein [Aneurinibacillus soli]PYE59259.1 iron complex transport system substrate-binding protein [Aneurinibacillus soli]BAU26751.1 Vitamin B12-binding protein precursor [Aneurinibacillus soli]